MEAETELITCDNCGFKFMEEDMDLYEGLWLCKECEDYAKEQEEKWNENS